MEGLIHIGCLTDRTQKRTQELREFLEMWQG